MGSVGYRLALAPYVTLNLVMGQGVGLTAALQPRIMLYTRTPAAGGEWATINLLALFALYCLWRAQRAARSPHSILAAMRRRAAV